MHQTVLSDTERSLEYAIIYFLDEQQLEQEAQLPQGFLNVR